MSEANLAERFVAALVALALQVVRNILLAPLVALRRILRPQRVRQVDAALVRPLRHRVLRPGQPPEAAVWEGDDAPTTRHRALTWGGEVVAVLTVVEAPEPGGAPIDLQLRGMAVAPELQGSGLGGRLLEATQRELGAPLWCNARVTAQRFYERHGWVSEGPEFDKPGIGPHVRMTWTPSLLPTVGRS